MQAISIYQPVHEELVRVEENLKKLGETASPVLARLLDHVFDTTGKAIRPALTLLASKFHPHDSAKPEIMATAVELLHIATLIHDDTVDNSDIRRGKATVSKLWGPQVAVLVGDYIFAVSATYVCDTGNIRVIRRFSETIMELSTGELHEMSEAFDWTQTREQYFNRIYKKTASLFTTASESGAMLSGAPEPLVKALRDYGYNLGMAFQIIDDILDYEGKREEVGKPVGNDLVHGIATLPAILLLERYPQDNPVAALFRDPEDRASLKRALDMVQDSSIIEDSYAVAGDFGHKALACLEGLPHSPARDSLEELVGYVLTRRK